MILFSLTVFEIEAVGETQYCTHVVERGDNVMAYECSTQALPRYDDIAEQWPLSASCKYVNQ